MNLRQAPSELSAYSKRVWKRILEDWDLDFQGRLLLNMALIELDKYRNATKDVLKQGQTYTSASGLIKRNPSVDIAKDARNGFLAAWTKLRLDVEPPGEIGRPGGGEF